MSCVLRVFGNFDVEKYLRTSKLRPSEVYKKGELRSPTTKAVNKHSGFNIVVSKKEFTDLPSQIRDSIAFLRSKRKELRKLSKTRGVRMTLDFGISVRDVAVQYDSFPAKLLLNLGELGVDLEISRYPIASPAHHVTVYIILDRNFGHKIETIPEGAPIWIVDSPINRSFVEEFRKKHPTSSHLNGVTTFQGLQGASTEDELLAELGTIDLHHGSYSSKTSYNTLEVIGAKPTPNILAAVRELGLSEVQETNWGFRAQKGMAS